MNEKYDYLFIGTIVGIAIVLLLGWFVKSTQSPSSFMDCIRACEEEGRNRPTSWAKECEEACLEKFRIK